MTFNHVIKLLVNLFVFLLSAWGEDESRLELRALAAFVLLLAQCLPGPATTETDGGRHRWRGGEMYGRKQMTKMRRRGRSDRKHREKKGGEREERKVRGRFGVWQEVLTHSLCLLIIRSMSSFIFLYLSSDSGLWPTESSASGSGLSQPFRPFFLNVCKQSSCTTQLKDFGVGNSDPGEQFGRGKWWWTVRSCLIELTLTNDKSN